MNEYKFLRDLHGNNKHLIQETLPLGEREVNEIRKR